MLELISNREELRMAVSAPVTASGASLGRQGGGGMSSGHRCGGQL